MNLFGAMKQEPGFLMNKLVNASIVLTILFILSVFFIQIAFFPLLAIIIINNSILLIKAKYNKTLSIVHVILSLAFLPFLFLGVIGGV
jgi:hypothetical protein